MRCRQIGLIGGMSWESSVHYYRLLNEGVRERSGGLHSSRCILLSMDFEEIATLQRAGDWDALTRTMIEAAQTLERAGAEAVLICTNTMHIMADKVQAAIGVPLLHIGEATGERVVTAGIERVGLLGTAYTMEQEFYRGRLAERFGLEVLVPDAAERKVVHDVIFEELAMGEVKDSSREACRKIIADLVARGAQGIVLGCTELMLLLSHADSSVSLFDTTAIHVEAALKFSLGD
jgi:aspartate racemase